MTSTARATDTGNLVLFVVGLISLVTVILGVLLFGVLGLVSAAAGEGESAMFTAWTMSGLIVLAAALLPGMYWSGRAILGLPIPAARVPATIWLALLVGYPACLGLGALAFNEARGVSILGPLALMGTAVVPVAAVAWLVRRLGPPLTPTRAWGHFTIGLTAMPLTALIVEFVAIMPLLLAAGFWLIGSAEGDALLAMMEQGTVPDPEISLELATQLLRSPLAIAAAYGYLAVVIPILEETIKTMAVWPFLRRGLAPAEAFLGGALGGAGYGLFEALFLTQPGEGWVMTTIARSGATILHVFTAALTSWGLMEGVRRRRYALMAVTFVAGLAMHAAWNAAAVTIGIVSFPIEGVGPSGLEGLAALAPVLLTGLIALSAAGLTLGWRRLAAQTNEPTP
ncbi:MAG TPA: hypothetical protein VLL77_09460 [Anaerolineales bacterium]|nr:hypothetical protein [Anaerolineales bacterium]